FGDVAVDALDIGIEDLLLFVGQRAELLVELRVAISEKARELVRRQIAFAQNLGQGPSAGAAIGLELPESILRHRVAAGDEQTAVGPREHVRNAELVSDDLDASAVDNKRGNAASRRGRDRAILQHRKKTVGVAVAATDQRHQNRAYCNWADGSHGVPPC